VLVILSRRMGTARSSPTPSSKTQIHQKFATCTSSRAMGIYIRDEMLMMLLLLLPVFDPLQAGRIQYRQADPSVGGRLNIRGNKLTDGAKREQSKTKTLKMWLIDVVLLLSSRIDSQCVRHRRPLLCFCSSKIEIPFFPLPNDHLESFEGLRASTLL